ncbi:MAG: hypothetical protein GX142_07050 [Chloroflexi bacterium]|nr:hypothetical protein [Chloroflexota bacterium]
MRTERQRARDLLLLSAHLDGELSPVDRQVLVARLQCEPHLQDRLEQLRRTKLTASYLPHLQAPRNYTLTPEMVPVRAQKKVSWLAPLRLATSLAAVLLVVLIGVEFLLNKTILARTRMAPAQEAAILTDETELEPLIVWMSPEIGDGHVLGRGGEAQMMDAPVVAEAQLDDEVATTETWLTEELLPAAEPETAFAEELESLLEIETLPPVDAEADTLAALEEGALDFILGINLDEGGELIQRSDKIVDPEPTQPVWQKIERVLQMVLGVIVLGGGLAWWLLSRRR